MPVSPADDQRHEPDGDAPEWNERWSFCFIDPKQQLCCVSRIGLVPNKGTCNVAVAMSRRGKTLYHRQLDGLPVPGGDVLSGIGAGGLSFRALSLPRARFLISFADPVSGFAFDVDWRGLHDPVDSMGLHAATSSSGLYGLRVEQLGRVVGRMTYRKQTFDLIGAGPRIHAVSESDWETAGVYDLALIMMDDGRAFGLSQLQHGHGLLQVPWMWDRENMVPLARLRFENTLDEEGRPLSTMIHVTDASGGTWLLNGTARTSMSCFFDGHVVHSGYCDFVLDDGTRGVGTLERGHRLGEGS